MPLRHDWSRRELNPRRALLSCQTGTTHRQEEVEPSGRPVGAAHDPPSPKRSPKTVARPETSDRSAHVRCTDATRCRRRRRHSAVRLADATDRLVFLAEALAVNMGIVDPDDVGMQVTPKKTA